MKTKSFSKKLELKKNTVARLNNVELNNVHGGLAAIDVKETDDIYCNTKLVGVCTCYGTCCTCPEHTCTG